MKIHGSVNAFGSIVATREDYERCYRRLSRGLLGSSLKMALATKTLLYVGFSFRDDDFVRIHRFLMREMRRTMPRSYLVTVDRAFDSQIADLGVQPIHTDATFFLSCACSAGPRQGIRAVVQEVSRYHVLSGIPGWSPTCADAYCNVQDNW